MNIDRAEFVITQNPPAIWTRDLDGWICRHEFSQSENPKHLTDEEFEELFPA